MINSRDRITISFSSKKRDKVMFSRKLKAMNEFIEQEIRPLEVAISNLIIQKQSLLDELQNMRTDLVNNCVHPKEFLFYEEKDDSEIIECKFCGKRLRSLLDGE